MFIRAPQGHSGSNLDTSTLFTQRLRKDTHHFCTRFQEDWCHKVFGQNEGRKAVCSSFVWTRIPTRSTSRTIAGRNIVMWNRRKLRVSSPKQRTVVSYVTTVLVEFLTKIINIKKGTEKVRESKNKRKEKYHQRRRADAIVIRRGTPQATSQKAKNHCKRDSLEKS